MEFNEIGKESIWGGDSLSKAYFKKFDPNKSIGESWELSDLDSGESVISNGEFKGKTLSYAIGECGERLLGNRNNTGYFPLLIKIIDAKEKLSIQVHPDESYANIRHDKHGKDEMWVIMEVKGDAKLLIGVKNDITKFDLKKALDSGKNIENMFNYVDIKPKDVFYIPSGCVHAILGNVILAEIQTPSDVTYRLYDWQRRDKNGNERELHIEDSFNVMREIDSSKLKLNRINKIKDNGYELYDIISNKHFTVEEISLKNREYKSKTNKNTFEIILVTEGEGSIEGSNTVKLKRAKTVLLPAFLGDYTVKTDREINFLKITK